MSDKPEVSTPDLEKLTNETYSEEYGGLNARTGEGSQTQEVSPEPESAPEVQVPATPEPTPESKAETPVGLKEAFTDTPFQGDDIVKSVQDAVKSWKSTTSEYDKLRSKVKPYEQFLDAMSSDAGLRNFLQQAETLYRNPNMLNAYVTPQGSVDTRPNPTHYNVTGQDGMMYFDQERYDKDLSDFLSRQVDSRINSRLSQMEQKNEQEKMTMELKQAFPEANADEVWERVKARGNSWRLVDAYKALEFDNIRSKALDEARKELTKKIETANSNATPTPTASSKTSVSLNDILTHVNKYGGESARKKFGDKNYQEALRESAANF